MKKLILFDLDGTLIDPYDAITKSLQYALEDAGIEAADRSQLKVFIGPPLRTSLREFYNITDNDEIERIYSKYLEYFSEHGIYENKLYPGVIEMLEELTTTGAVLTIATSKLMVSARKIAKLLSIDRYFEHIIGCERDGSRSQKSEIIKYILDKMGHGYDPVMVGDRKYDIAGAKEIGIDNIGVTWGYGSREELEEAGAVQIADSLEELLRLLTKA